MWDESMRLQKTTHWHLKTTHNRGWWLVSINNTTGGCVGSILVFCIEFITHSKCSFNQKEIYVFILTKWKYCGESYRRKVSLLVAQRFSFQQLLVRSSNAQFFLQIVWYAKSIQMCADVANSIAKLWGPGAFLFPASQGVQGLYYPAVSWLVKLSTRIHLFFSVKFKLKCSFNILYC